MEDVCLADFACKYRRNTKQKNPVAAEEGEAEDGSDDDHAGEVNDDSSVGPVNNAESKYVLKAKPLILRYTAASKSGNPHQYWRSQLMLFKPWRNEEAEIEAVDPIDAADGHSEEIYNNSKEYYYSRSIDDSTLENLIEELQETQNEQAQDLSVIENDMALAEDVDYLNEGFTGRQSSLASIEKFRPPTVIDEEEYFGIMRNLNVKQRKIVLHVLNCSKTGGDKLPFHIFLSGGAGVGKSRVVTAIVQCYIRYCHSLRKGDINFDPEEVFVVISAPTGKAAFNIFGMTLHSAFRIPPTQYRGEKSANLDRGSTNTLHKKFKNAKLFINDEVSMVGASQLQQISDRLKQITLNGQPDDEQNPIGQFGCRSILVVGHLRQLPPFAMRFPFQPPQLPAPESARSNLVRRNPLWEPFRLFELTEIMRQKGEADFCKALNNMSEGVMDEDDIALIKERKITKDLVPPVGAVWLYQYNKDCEAYNKKIHDSLDTENILSTAHDYVAGDGNERNKLQLLERAKSFDQSQADGLAYQLNLQVGGIYFMTCNVNVSDGLFNGATGILMRIDYGNSVSTGERIPRIAWIKFEHSSIGQNLRAASKHLYRVGNIDKSLTPIFRIKRVLNSYKHKGLKVTREQMPLKAANGMTIAKSQGSSLEHVVVIIPKRRTLTRQNIYVACSRATSINGLYIDGDFKPPSKPTDDDLVTKEMEILRSIPFTFTLLFADTRGSGYKLYYHNVQSLPKYKQDVIKDPNIMVNDFIAFVEPHINPFSDTHLQRDFVDSYRVNSTFGQANYTLSDGFLFYHKRSMTTYDPSRSRYIAKKHTVGHSLIFLFYVEDRAVAVCYKHPRTSKPEFLDHLADVLAPYLEGRLIVLGDLNFDMTLEQNSTLKDFFSQRNLVSKLDFNLYTTDRNTHIDVCFSNFDDVKCSIYETYYSYHKPLCIDF